MGIELTSEAWEDAHGIQAWSSHSKVMLRPGLAQSGKVGPDWRVRCIAAPRNQSSLSVYKGLLAHSSSFSFFEKVQKGPEFLPTGPLPEHRPLSPRHCKRSDISASSCPSRCCRNFSGVLGRSIIDAERYRQACSPQC
jgi:hypothetical protein